MIFEWLQFGWILDGRCGRRQCGKVLRTWYTAIGALVIALALLGCQVELDDNTAALVNGRSITMAELDNLGDSHTQTEKDGERNQTLRGQLLEQLIEEELIVQEADAKGITVSEDELQQRIDMFISDFPGQTFQDMLVREYIDYDTWREKVRRGLLVEKATSSELATRITMNPKELEEAFRARIALQARPRRFLVRHITTTDENLAKQIRRRIQSGEEFEAVARELAKSAGEPEPPKEYWVYTDRLPQAMARAITGTSMGKVSEIVRSDFGFSIFQVLKIERYDKADAESVLADVKRLYWEKRRAEAYQSWLNELKQKAVIVINPTLTKAAEMYSKSEQTR